MNEKPEWQYDEMEQCGVDYANPDVVKGYEESHGRLEKCKQRAEKIIEELGVGGEDVVMDMGCGTGGFVFLRLKNAGGSLRSMCRGRCWISAKVNVKRPVLAILIITGRVF